MKKLSFSRYFCRVRRLDAPLLTESAQIIYTIVANELRTGNRHNVAVTRLRKILLIVAVPPSAA